MTSPLESRLKTTLKRIENSIEKILSTRGYTKEVNQLRMLQELIKEQVPNESSISTTRSVR